MPDRRNAHQPPAASQRRIIFNLPVALPDQTANERIYALPPDLFLEPQTEYKISLEIPVQNKTVRLFAFNFHTDDDAPLAF